RWLAPSHAPRPHRGTAPAPLPCRDRCGPAAPASSSRSALQRSGRWQPAPRPRLEAWAGQSARHQPAPTAVATHPATARTQALQIAASSASVPRGSALPPDPPSPASSPPLRRVASTLHKGPALRPPPGFAALPAAEAPPAPPPPPPVAPLRVSPTLPVPCTTVPFLTTTVQALARKRRRWAPDLLSPPVAPFRPPAATRATTLPHLAPEATFLTWPPALQPQPAAPPGSTLPDTPRPGECACGRSWDKNRR